MIGPVEMIKKWKSSKNINNNNNNNLDRNGIEMNKKKKLI